MRHACLPRAVLLVLIVGSGVQAAAQGGTVTDQAVSLVYPPTHWTDTPVASINGATVSADPIYQTGWWYRAQGDTREFHLPAPDSESYFNGVVTATWSNLDGKGFTLQERTYVFDNEGPSGGFSTEMYIMNNNPGSREFTLFHYADFDVGGTFDGDSGAQLGFRLLKFTEGPRTARYRSAAYHFEVGAYPSLRDKLNDAVVTTLADTGLPFGPGDATAAFQFGPITLGAGGSYVLGPVGLGFDLAFDKVKGDLFGGGAYPELFAEPPDLSLHVAVAMRRTSQLAPLFFAVPAGSSVKGIDDFNGDFLDEVLARDPTTGQTTVGSQAITGAPTLPLNWHISAVGDFNGDGRSDIVWRNVTSQKVVIWTMNGAAKTGSIIPSPDQAVDANWEIVGAADFNGDGRRDFLWYNQTSGKIVLWYMNAFVVRVDGLFTTPASVGNNNWRVVAVGDFGKGPDQGLTPVYNTQDIVWQNDTSKKIVVWHMDHAATRTAGVFTTPDALAYAGYEIVGPR